MERRSRGRANLTEPFGVHTPLIMGNNSLEGGVVEIPTASMQSNGY